MISSVSVTMNRYDSAEGWCAYGRFEGVTTLGGVEGRLLPGEGLLAKVG